jgi:carbon-monoxide dehydrogenase large subunit
VKVDERGQVAVLIGVSGSGQGHETVFAQVCAEYLGARFEDVHVRGGDTMLVAHGYGTGANRVAVNTGNAVADAAVSVEAKACRVAARLPECAAEDVRIEVIANALSDAFDGRLDIRTLVLTPAHVHALLREARVAR